MLVAVVVLVITAVRLVALLGQAVLVVAGMELLAITLAMLAAPLVLQTRVAVVVEANFQVVEI